MTELEAQNSIKNHIDSLGNKSTESLTSYGAKKAEKSLNSFNKNSEKIYLHAIKRVQAQSSKFANKKRITRELIIDEALVDISALRNQTSGNFAIDLMNFVRQMIKAIWKTITDLVSKIFSLITNPGQIIDFFLNFAAGLFDALATSLLNIAAKIISDFMKALNAMVQAVVGRIMGIITMINNAIDMAKNAFDKFQKFRKAFNDYYKRSKGLSDTPVYIQVNVPDIKGKMQNKAKETIDKHSITADKIVTNLKKDIQKTFTFNTDPLAKLLGFLGSLAPSENKKKVEEPKPTDDKAQYGTNIVTQSQGGHVSIQDSTPDNVRTVEIHPSGSYISTLNDGSHHTKTVADKQEITEGNWNIKTFKDKIEIIEGDSKFEIRRNLESKISGDVNNYNGGLINSVVEGEVSNDYKSDYSGKIAGDYIESVEGNKTELTSGNVTETIKGSHKETVHGSLTIHVTGNVNIVSGGNAILSASGQVAINASKIKLG